MLKSEGLAALAGGIVGSLKRSDTIVSPNNNNNNKKQYSKIQEKGRSPLPRSFSHGAIQSSSSSSLETEEDLREWEEARCPVCMEHPHNAVLLICASYEKGCRPYMCDTSYRHSNCFDQFCKSFVETPAVPLEEATLHTIDPSPIISIEAVVNESQEEKNKDPISAGNLPNMRKLHQKLLCPLCRGQVLGCTVVESARNLMNDKIRSCARETCIFDGNYTDLRKHARKEHPLIRPSEADPERQHDWRMLERQRDIGDVLSTIQSSFGEDHDATAILPFEGRSLLTVFFFIRVFNAGGSSRSSSWSGTSRGQAQIGIRRRSVRLWGESYDEETTSVHRDVGPVEARETRSQRSRRRSRVAENDGVQIDPASRDMDQDSSNGESGVRTRRVRRRTARYDQQQ
ncbi:hypothetical protein V2J09_002882 [Rumex salicifolius]